MENSTSKKEEVSKRRRRRQQHRDIVRWYIGDDGRRTMSIERINNGGHATLVTIRPNNLVYDGVDYFIFLDSKYTESKYNCVWARLCIDTKRVTGAPKTQEEMVCQTNIIVAMRFHGEYSILTPVSHKLVDTFYGRATCRKKLRDWGKTSRIIDCAYIGPELFENDAKEYERYLFANHFKDAKEPECVPQRVDAEERSMTFVDLFLRKVQQTESIAREHRLLLHDDVFIDAIAKQCVVLAALIDASKENVEKKEGK